MRNVAFMIINPLGQIGKWRKGEMKWLVRRRRPRSRTVWAVKQSYIPRAAGGQRHGVGDRDTDRELPGACNAFPGLHFKLSLRQPEHLRGACSILLDKA